MIITVLVESNTRNGHQVDRLSTSLVIIRQWVQSVSNEPHNGVRHYAFSISHKANSATTDLCWCLFGFLCLIAYR